MKLNLGCGSRTLEGYVNLDWRITEQMCYTGGYSVQGKIQQLPFKDNIFSHIYCRHVLEHFWFEELSCILAEIHRVIMYLGEFYIIVPHFKWHCERYWSSNYSEEDVEKYSTTIWGLPRYHGAMHHFGYDEKTLLSLMEKAKFRLKEILSRDSELVAIFVRI